MAQLLAAIAPAVAGLLGVILGGLLTGRVASLARRHQEELARTAHSEELRKAREDQIRTACARYLGAARRGRHHILHAVEEPDEVTSRDGLTRVVYVRGTSPYLDDLDDALANLHMVIASEEVFTRAMQVGRVIQSIATSRRERGRGNVPADLIVAAKIAEWDFANAARAEVGLPPLDRERVTAFDFRDDPEFQQRVLRRQE